MPAALLTEVEVKLVGLVGAEIDGWQGRQWLCLSSRSDAGDLILAKRQMGFELALFGCYANHLDGSFGR